MSFITFVVYCIIAFIVGLWIRRLWRSRDDIKIKKSDVVIDVKKQNDVFKEKNDTEIKRTPEFIADGTHDLSNFKPKF